MPKYVAMVLFLSVSQSVPGTAQSLGYVFGAIGRETGYSGYLHGGVGGDWIVGKGFGLSGEVGGIANRRAGAPNLALISGNGSYHLPGSAVDPFLTAGVSLVTAGRSAELMTN